MRSLRLVAVLPMVAAVGCYSDGPAQSTFPGPGTEPTADPRYVTGPGSTGTSRAAGGPGPGYVAGPPPGYVAGPPGGQMDPGSVYEAPGYQPPAMVDPNAPDPAGPEVAGEPGPDGGDPTAEPGPDGDPSVVAGVDPGAANPTSNVTDPEIDNTLAGYGQWIQSDDYGEIWRPDATVVGADFTPYESGGQWQDTDAGWAFASEYTWGWLPFHYGRWAWFHDYWGWVPGHRWGPAWVEWRHGSAITGWRALGPGGGNGYRFHTHAGGGLIVEHRHAEQHEAHWRFATNRDFAQPHIRSHLSNNLAENLRVTQRVNAPPIRSRTIVHTNDVMHARFEPRPSRPVFGRDQRQMANPAMRPQYPTVGRTYQPYQPSGGDAPAARGYVPPRTATQPTSTYAPGRVYQPSRPTFNSGGPIRGSAPVWSAPARTYSPPATSGGGFHPSAPSAPSSGGYHPSAPSAPSSSHTGGHH
jgi:hypothetical protein